MSCNATTFKNELTVYQWTKSYGILQQQLNDDMVHHAIWSKHDTPVPPRPNVQSAEQSQKQLETESTLTSTEKQHKPDLMIQHHIRQLDHFVGSRAHIAAMTIRSAYAKY